MIALGAVNVYGGIVARVNVYNPSSGTWSPGVSMNTPRKASGATLLSNGKILIAGGTTQAGALLTSSELYDPTTNSWSYTGSMLSARSSFPVASLGNGLALAVGSGSPSQTSCELYNPTTGQWSYTGTMIQVLAVAGTGLSGPMTSAELYTL